MVWEIFAVMYTDTKFRYIEMIDNQIDTLVSEGKARSEFLYDVVVDADQELKPTVGLEKNASIKAPQF